MDNFDYIYYLKKYKDLRDANINNYNRAFNHWKKYGKFKRHCNKITDPYKYECHIYIISPIKDGGSHKYINNIIDYLERINKNYIIIKNKEELDYMKEDFNNEDLLIVQYLHNTNIKFVDIENIINTNINLILPIHDFYFIYSNENINTNIHNIPTKKHKIKHNLFKLAKYIIFPSQFMYNIFVNIIGTADNYYIVPHNDNLNYNNKIYIPKILNNQINIGVITNVNYIKGYRYYVELCRIKKYNNNNIHYYFFGNVNKNNLTHNYIHHEGIYNEDDIYIKLNNKNIHGLMFMNNCPETYCYALTKGINSRLPILYTNIGAVGERLGYYNNSRFHIYNDINSFYNFINDIIINNNTGTIEELNLDIIINPFYIKLFNV